MKFFLVILQNKYIFPQNTKVKSLSWHHPGEKIIWNNKYGMFRSGHMLCSLPRLWHSICYHIDSPQIHSHPQYSLQYIPPF